MSKRIIKSFDAPVPVARYSQGILVNNTLYVQGVIALDPQSGQIVDDDIEVQSERVFKSIQSILEMAEMNMTDIVKINVFLKNLSDYAKFNQIYNSYFLNDSPPARTTVQAKLPFDALVEVEVIACKG